MPCNLDVICYIDQYSEVARKSNFIVNAVGIVSSRHQKVNIYVHIVAFYPKEESRDSDLEKFNKGDIIKVQGRFSIIETEVQGNKIKVIKMVACDICVLNLDEQDLPQSSLSVVLIGVASDNSDVSDDKVTLNMIAREYIDNQNNESLSFELYHFPNDAHLLPTSSKVLRGSSLYVTGNLSIIDELLLVRITQINFIGQMHSNPQKSSNYAWEKKQMDSSSTQVSSTPSPADIAKSISDKSKKRGKSQGTSLLSRQKIPKLSSLSLPQVITDDEDTHIEDSSSSLPQPNTESDHQEETQTDMENNEKPQRPKRGRGGRRKK